MAARDHAALSASGAARWMACPASVAMEAGLPESPSVYAAEGTAAHDLAEQCLRGGVNADAYLNDVVSDFTVDQDMVDAVQRYLDHVRAHTGTVLVEQRVDFSPWVPGGFGTADAIVLYGKTASVIDLKYGRGVRIDAENNPQAMLYALGALHTFGFVCDQIATVRLIIIQPRLDHISEWEIGRDDLLRWAEDTLKPAAWRTLAPDAPFQPGETPCRFCKAKAVCPALAEHNLKTATDEFDAIGDPVTPRDPARLSLTEIAALLPQLPLLTDWARAVAGHATAQAEAGHAVPGHKLVAGRSVRQWADEQAAEAALRKRKLKVAEIFTRKLISPTQAEKTLGRDHVIIQRHVIKPPGKPMLVPVDDPRPALEVALGSDFDTLENTAEERKSE